MAEFVTASRDAPRNRRRDDSSDAGSGNGGATVAAIAGPGRQGTRLSPSVLSCGCGASESLEASQRENALLAETLDLIAQAVAWLDASARVVRANRAAQQVFAGDRGLSLSQDERLVVTHGESRETLLAALAACGRFDLPPGVDAETPATRIALPRAEAWPLLLTLQPLLPSSTECGAVALLFIVDPGTQPPVHSEALQFAYGLSPVEARLVQALTEGLSLKEFARRHDVSYETVRTYIKRVLAKTGARRQAELVRLTGALR